MLAKKLLKAFTTAQKRTHLVGDITCGVIISLDMEGRLFTIFNGRVLNRVNMHAVSGQSTIDEYLNSGGDALWPAPEGTTAGYQYSTGRWRPSPSIRNARYLVTASKFSSATVQSEVDLINNNGLGIPALFRRVVQVLPGKNSVTVNTNETIQYLGRNVLKRKEALLAPWSLCQFDSGENCSVKFPCASTSSVWDLYDEPSSHQRSWKNNVCLTKTDGQMRYQAAMDKNVPWIEYADPAKGFTVKRIAKQIPADHQYIDIRDASPDTSPSAKGVRYSVYSDTSGFMEIEAAGGMPRIIKPGTELTLSVSTRYRFK